MINDGEQILKSTRNFRKYLKNIGDLLSTVEAILGKHGYITPGSTISGNIAWADSSTSIRYPHLWFPHNAFRFLQHKTNDHILVVISVIIDDIDNPDSLTQPVISAAWFHGKTVGNEYNNDYRYYSRIILSLQEYSLEGKMIDIPREKIKYEAILSCKALAVPLVDIQSGSDIEKKIISPLVASLSEVI